MFFFKMLYNPWVLSIMSETNVNTRGNDIFRSNRANQEELLLPFFIPFPNSLHKRSEVRVIINRFVKMEWQISVGPVQPVKEDHLQRWSQTFQSGGTQTDLSI